MSTWARPISQLVFLRAISAEDMEAAFERADTKAMDLTAMGDQRRSARSVFISAEGPAELVKAASIEAIEHETPTGGVQSRSLRQPDCHLRVGRLRLRRARDLAGHRARRQDALMPRFRT